MQILPDRCLSDTLRLELAVTFPCLVLIGYALSEQTMPQPPLRAPARHRPLRGNWTEPWLRAVTKR